MPAVILTFTMVLVLCACESETLAETAEENRYIPAEQREGQEYVVGDYKIKVFDDTRDTAIVDYMGNDTVLVVPREIDGYSVSIIARKALLSVAEIVKETKEEDVPPLLKRLPCLKQ
mgnify:CR=1 FL=1